MTQLARYRPSRGQRLPAATDTLGHEHRFSLADLEWAQAWLAYTVVTYGDVYLPLLDRMTREIAHAQKALSGVARARSILSDYSRGNHG